MSSIEEKAPALRLAEVEEFLDRCPEVYCTDVPEGLGPCFKPMLAPAKNGYVYKQTSDGKVQVSRWVCEVVNGDFDPALQVLHRCDNTWCVAPLHLRPGTKSDNARHREARRKILKAAAA
ncbi:MAG: HNH endonuclease [Myxococcaceae bacterium]